MSARRFDQPWPRVAVLQLPGVNCEYETRAVLARAELDAEIFRWNRPARDLEEFDAYVIPGGFSYEDRIRAGAVAAKVKALDVVVAAAEAGKPVLGICNGAQVLVEAGLVPGVRPGFVEAALAENAAGWKGYYCAWVHVRVVKEGRETAFTSRFEDGEIVPMPVAHAQGRFTVRDRERFAEWMENGQVPLRYVTPDGDDDPSFPFNPNGSLFGAAGMTNPAGNVLALMPHPERAARLRNVPDTLAGPWGERRRDGARQRELLDGPGPGFKIFQSLSDYLRWGGDREGEVMTEAVVRLWLKVNDPTALTAHETLQRAMGYGRIVAGVSRSEVWAFRWRETVEAAPVLESLARETNLLLNPNKHRMEIAVGESALSPRGNVSVLVWTAGEGRDLEETLRRHRLLSGSVPAVRRGTLWELDLVGAAAERSRLAEEIAVARERGRGLLANPHVADVRIFGEPPSASAVVRALSGESAPAPHGLH